jgi:hypothetical protein
MKAGVQPLNKLIMPSLRIMLVIAPMAPVPEAVLALMIRVLMTSTGEQTVVATKPYQTIHVSKHAVITVKSVKVGKKHTANRLDPKWTPTPSLRPTVFNNRSLNTS